MEQPEEIIRLHEVTKTFNSGKPNEFTALKSVSLTVGKGLLTVLKGPSGSGKTTLLTLVGGMARPTSGRIFVGEREITSLPERFLTAVRRDTFGFVFQQFNLIKGLSALENVLIPAYPGGERYSVLHKKGLALLELLDVAHRAEAKVEWLSGGEAQRVVIARALVNDPQIVIADEPTAHLDSRLSAEFMEIAGRLKGEGKTVVVASHDPVVYDSPLVDRVVEMRDGAIE